MYELPNELHGRWNKTGHLLLWFYAKHRSGQSMSVQHLAQTLNLQYIVLHDMLTGKEPSGRWVVTMLTLLRKKGYQELVLLQHEKTLYPQIAGRLRHGSMVEIVHRRVVRKKDARCSDSSD